MPRTATIDECLDAYMERRLQQQDVAIQLAQKNQKEHDKIHMDRDPLPETEYPVGSYVLVAWPITRMNMGRPTKLDVMYRGPYQVVAHDKEREAYRLKELVNNTVGEWTKVHLLKPYYYDASRTDVAEMARRDKPDHFLVDRILDHRGNWQRKGTLEFLVKWVGYPNPEEFTWEPWKNVRDNEELHAYLRIKGKARHIPKKISESLEDVVADRDR